MEAGTNVRSAVPTVDAMEIWAPIIDPVIVREGCSANTFQVAADGDELLGFVHASEDIDIAGRDALAQFLKFDRRF